MKKHSLRCLLATTLAFAMVLTGSGFGTAANVFAADDRKIDVWDFGGVEETDTTKYTNNITTAGWDAYDNLGADGKFAANSTVTFGDLTVTMNANDRVYSGIGTKNYGSSSYATTDFGDGYVANGMYYCNGTGGANRRYLTLTNVEAGDKIVVYMGAHSGEDNLVFDYLGADGTQSEKQAYEKVFTKHVFIAQYSGTYKIWTEGTAKTAFNRVVRMPGVTVSGQLEAGAFDLTGTTLSFVNNETGVETPVTVADGKFSVNLASGYEYTAVLAGVSGIGFTNDSKIVTVSEEDVLKNIDGVKLVVETKSVYDYTGSITGFAEDYDLSKLSIKLLAPADTTFTDVNLTINADLTFKASLEPDVEYTLELSGVNDYEIVNGVIVKDNQNLNKNIEVATRAGHKVSGGFLGCEAKDVTGVQFINEEDGYTYTGAVTADGYTATLRDGAYKIVITSADYKTSTHVVVNGADVTKDIMAVPVTEATVVLERVDTIYVGYPDKNPNYDTVGEAVAAAAAMNPESEADRITISIAPGTYREQIIVKAPYLSFVNETKEEVLLTWYYGIGYKYYSADVKGLYNPENAYDKYEKNIAANWGFAVKVEKTATAFRAEGITFENSFNRYITDEEIEDGVECDTCLFVRKYGADVTSKAATERAAAIYVAADKSEFVNCSFLSSQDTLYTAADIYFKDCFIEGNTDFIFGGGDVVFDTCEISLYGYSTGAVAGYITAMRTDGGSTQNGYLFRNCVITADSLPVANGYYLGRPWGADAKVRFENTKVADAKLLNAAGWTQMSGNQPENANFAEYNTTDLTGTALDVSARVAGSVKTEAVGFDYESYLGFAPANAVKAGTSVAFETAPYLVDNGDINAPKPGHTLTACYSLGTANDANDASVICWYRVKDGEATLIKVSSAVVDDTYQITTEDIGAKIMVTVSPLNTDNVAGEAKSSAVTETVREGYDNPDATKAEAVLGEGINVYLAGDSTVKDYSAEGMYNKGANQTEGSWGEYFDEFLNEDLVTVVNYANGGRSTRNFINEGSLAKIAETIKEGDYLFIQFGHNDCSNTSGHLEDRFVPLGTPDANGIYPTTAGVEVATPSSLQSKYGDTFYSYDCGGTFKWYLLQYINVAREAGAIPVLVTPVSRLNFDADGNIVPKHDSTDTTTGTQVTSGNAYVKAVQQLAAEENVLLIDGTEITKAMYEAARQADTNVSSDGKTSPLAKQALTPGDSTHSSKLGGFISAAYLAREVQKMDCTLSIAVQAPSQVLGETPKGENEFVMSGNGTFTAYSADAEGKFTTKSEYWTKVGQALVEEIALEAEKLNGAYTKSTMWVIGDSTVCGFTDNYFYPRYGYGTQLLEYFDADKFDVQNLALSGRSSLSFLTEANYKTLIDGMQAGDVLIIGFGHNDEKAEAARYTNPNGDYKTAGSFANNLYENYVKIAEAKGVTVILCTPIVRRTPDGVWKDSYLHVTADDNGFAGGNYAEAIRKLGKDVGVAVVDMTTLTKELYDSLGADGSLYLHAWLSSKPGSVDNTHTNIWGAKYNAYLFAKEVKALNISGVSEFVGDVSKAPAKAETLVSNPDYVEPTYDGSNLGQSKLWADYGIFKGTVFGDVGGNPSTANQTLETDANGNMHIVVANNKGKIASGTDGIAMYYYRLPADATFTLTADMTINGFDTNNQVAFGLMVRDAMYIDVNTKEANGDSVNAAFYRLADFAAGNGHNCYARKDGKLVSGGSLTGTYAIGDTVALKLSGTADGYATTIGNEETVTGGFDFKLTSYDADYVYIGMFAARNADVTFSNIKLTVNGREVDIFGSGELPSEDIDTPVVTGDVYVVQKGDTLRKIAKAAGVTVKELLAVNDIENPNLIFKGMQINIPKVEKDQRYIVVKGDTLNKIAKANGCTVADLLKANEFKNPDFILPGDVVYLP